MYETVNGGHLTYVVSEARNAVSHVQRICVQSSFKVTHTKLKSYTLNNPL